MKNCRSDLMMNKMLIWSKKCNFHATATNYKTLNRLNTMRRVTNYYFNLGSETPVMLWCPKAVLRSVWKIHIHLFTPTRAVYKHYKIALYPWHRSIKFVLTIEWTHNFVSLLCCPVKQLTCMQSSFYHLQITS